MAFIVLNLLCMGYLPFTIPEINLQSKDFYSWNEYAVIRKKPSHADCSDYEQSQSRAKELDFFYAYKMKINVEIPIIKTANMI